jgi:hypothetical protein
VEKKIKQNRASLCVCERERDGKRERNSVGGIEALKEKENDGEGRRQRKRMSVR